MLSPTRPSNTRKRCPFHHRGLECQSRKSRDPCSNRQVWPWTTKWSRARLTKLCQENALVIPHTLFHNTRDDSTHGHHQMVNTVIRLIIFFPAKDGDALYSQQKQDWDLTVAPTMNSLMQNSDLNWKVGKTTRPSKYDLNHWDIIRNLMGRTSRKAIVFD